MAADNPTHPDPLIRLLRSGGGAFPTGVLQDAGWPLPVAEAGSPTPRPGYEPDLSLVRGEWYFSRATAARISDMADGNVLCVGTPTVAVELGRRGVDTTLIEPSPWVGDRLSLEGVTLDARPFEVVEASQGYDSVIFDPPWYAPMIEAWIARAAGHVRSGGRLLFPLLGAATRPSAQTDRETVLKGAAEFGRVRREPVVVEYDVPYFEAQALEAAGIRIVSPWRLADLVVVDVDLPAAPVPVGIEAKLPWVEFRIGSRLVAVRRRLIEGELGHGDSDASTLLQRLEGATSPILDTVSRRDTRWDRIDVWFSNNKVARTRHGRRLAAVLGALEVGNHRSPRIAAAARHDDCVEVDEWAE